MACRRVGVKRGKVYTRVSMTARVCVYIHGEHARGNEKQRDQFTLYNNAGAEPFTGLNRYNLHNRETNLHRRGRFTWSRHYSIPRRPILSRARKSNLITRGGKLEQVEKRGKWRKRKFRFPKFIYNFSRNEQGSLSISGLRR